MLSLNCQLHRKYVRLALPLRSTEMQSDGNGAQWTVRAAAGLLGATTSLQDSVGGSARRSASPLSCQTEPPRRRTGRAPSDYLEVDPLLPPGHRAELSHDR